MVKNVFKLLLVMAIALWLAACGSALPSVKPYKMEIQQGNVVTSKMLLQLKPGMTKSQVRYILGTPLIVDSFHGNRWDYFYQLRQGGKIVEQRRVILTFDKDKLMNVRGDVVPQGTPGAVSGEPPLSKSTVQTETKDDKSLLDRLKFWKSDDKAKANQEAPKAEGEKLPAPTGKQPVEAPAAVMPGAVQSENAESESAPSETPSILAVPIGGAEAPSPAVQVLPTTPEPTPVQPAPVVAPVTEPAQVEPVKAEPVKPEPVKAEPVKAEPAPVKSEPVKQEKMAPSNRKPNAPAAHDDKQIFRMDKTLDMNHNVEAVPVPEAAPAVEVAPEPAKESAPKKKKKKADDEPLPPETEPTFFDRMLEKIGF